MLGFVDNMTLGLIQIVKTIREAQGFVGVSKFQSNSEFGKVL